jgi:predicted transcriptional regulator
MTNLAVLDILERTIFRAEHNKDNPYTVISNKLLRDPNIKRSDKGLLVELLSWGDKHRVCVQALVNRGKEGRDAIQGMLNRLDDAGYIKKTQIKNSDGTFGKVVYQIFESAQDGKIMAVIEDSQSGENEAAKLLEQAQLGFDFEAQINDSKEETVNGFSVDGKPLTNKYNNLRSNLIFNKREGEVVNDKDLLERFHLKLDDPIVAERIKMSGLGLLVQTQRQLDTFLLDFNVNHDQYKKISDHQRLNNFIKFLLKIQHSRVGQRAHVARLKALGSTAHHDVRKPTSSKKKNFDRFILPIAFKTEPTQPVVASNINPFKGF